MDSQPVSPNGEAGCIIKTANRQYLLQSRASAIVGSMERFIGILIEHYAGTFPAWLAPVQVIVISLTEKQAEFAVQMAESLKKHGFRVDLDLRNETIGLKIREHAIQRVPYQLVIGAREVEDNTVAVRTRNGEDLGSMSIDAFVQRLNDDIACLGHSFLGRSNLEE